MEKYDEDMEQAVWDAVMERPYGFCVSGERYALYPVSLGKSVLLSRLMRSLDIDEPLLRLNPAAESLRIARRERETACRIISVCTIGGKERLFDEPYVSARADFFRRSLTDEETAQLLLVILRSDRADSFAAYYGLDRERREREKIARVRNKGANTVTFGGRSPYGAIIGAACERYGWTVDYVVWGISYTSLRMMLADAVESVYLSDEERKTARVRCGEEVVNMDDPKSWARIKSMKWD